MMIRNNLLILFSFFLYSSLIFGFIYGEDFNGGAKNDFFTIIKNAKLFIDDTGANDAPQIVYIIRDTEL